MISIFITLLTALIFFIGLTGLITEPARRFHKIAFYAALTICVYYVAPHISHYVAFVYICSAIIFILFSYTDPLTQICFSLLGYLLSMLINHFLTIPLSLFQISISDISSKYPISFLLADVILTYIVISIVKHQVKKLLIYSKTNLPAKLQLLCILEFLAGLVIMIINLVFDEAAGYSTANLMINGILVFLFTLLSLFLFFVLYQTMQKNQKLSEYAQAQESMNDYLTRMESFYDEIRVFRHDYLNILSTLQVYLDEKRYSELTDYYYQKILPGKESMNANSFTLSALANVQILELKSLLYTKIVKIMNQKIDVNLEIRDQIVTLDLDNLLLCRIVGIMLDNAMEAASETESPFINLSMIYTDSCMTILIDNSTCPLEQPLQQLFQKGFTTKQNHSGLGLYAIKEITNRYDNVTYSISLDTLFHQQLTIREKKETL